MLGSLISAGADLLGGLIGKSSADKQSAMQKEFAQNGIQWKVADAKKAGIHPLYALGANTMSYSPVATGDFGVSQAGQDIGRAIDATRGHNDRAQAVQKTMNDLTVTRMGLENELLAAQIAKTRQAGQPPARQMPGDVMLIDGQGQTALPSAAPGGNVLVEDQPNKRVISMPGAPSQEAGAVTDQGFTRTPTGYAPVMSKDAKERLEEDFVGGLTWNLRNRVLPSFRVNETPPQVPVPEGYDGWAYHPIYQEYRPYKKHWWGITYK